MGANQRFLTFNENALTLKSNMDDENFTSQDFYVKVTATETFDGRSYQTTGTKEIKQKFCDSDLETEGTFDPSPIYSGWDAY